MNLPFSLPSTQNIPIRKTILKKQSHSSPEEICFSGEKPWIATLNSHPSQLHATYLSFLYQHHFVVEIVTSLQKKKGRG